MLAYDISISPFSSHIPGPSPCSVVTWRSRGAAAPFSAGGTVLQRDAKGERCKGRGRRSAGGFFEAKWWFQQTKMKRFGINDL